MKNVYYIGRDDSCDIILQDDSNVISRTHAILRVGKGGRYTISDQSMNGTYINGIRISSGVEVPVSRTDTISFAHLVDFDWSLIPNTAKRTRIILFSIVAGLLLIATLCWGAVKLFGDRQTTPAESSPVIENTSDEAKTDADSLKAVATPAIDNALDKKSTSVSTAKTSKGKDTVKDSAKQIEETKNTTTEIDTVKEKKNINPLF